MKYPDYIQPLSINEIWGKIPEGKKICFLAGGTDLLCYLRDGLIDDNYCFVDINRLNELSGITEDEENIKIGARTTFAEISENHIIEKWSPGLFLSSKTIGTPQIANRATIGGNIANASPSGDSIPPLIVNLAKLEICGAGGRMVVGITDIFVGPKKTNLSNGELITSVLVPKIKTKSGFELKGAFKKIGGRKSHIISKASVAVLAGIKERYIDFINISFGAVAPVVVAAEEVSKILSGKEITEELLKKCELEIQKIITPIDDFRSTALYRRHIIPALFRQAIEEMTR